MRFEGLLDQVGGFGPFQLRNLVLMALPRILLPLHFLLPVFLAAVPSHHCALPGTPANISLQHLWLEAHLPREPDGTFSSCLHFAHPWARPNTTVGKEAQSLGDLEGTASTVPCSQGWEYDSSEFSSTIATEWDLVCEHKGLNKVISTLFFIGVLVGAVIFGYLSDRFGRRSLLLVAYVSSLVLGLASVASVNYIMFAITRTFTGLALAGFTVIVLPLELEWLDVEHRTVAGVLGTIFWSGGVMLLALIGYLIRDWRWLLLAVTLPLVLGIVSIWWVPESARWLLTQGHVQEAQSYLLRCARLNGRPVGEDGLSVEALSKVASAERVVRRPSYLDLFRTPRLRHISLCCMMMWFGVNFSYYGLTLDLSGLGLTVFQRQLLFGAVEIPSKLVVYLSVRYMGRRPTEVGTLVGTALSFGLRLLVPSGEPRPAWPRLHSPASCKSLPTRGLSYNGSTSYETQPPPYGPHLIPDPVHPASCEGHPPTTALPPMETPLPSFSTILCKDSARILGAPLSFPSLSGNPFPSETKSWLTALTVMGKAFSEASFTTAYLFTSELYPTVLRQTGLGLTSLVGRLGGSLAPLAALLDGVWLPLPNIAYGGIALLAACTTLLLPETKRAQLPETIQDVERTSALPSVQEEEMQIRN